MTLQACGKETGCETETADPEVGGDVLRLVMGDSYGNRINEEPDSERKLGKNAYKPAVGSTNGRSRTHSLT